MLLILDGVSAAGKTTICNNLVDLGWVYFGKYMDRNKRHEELLKDLKGTRSITRHVKSSFFDDKKNDSNFIYYKYGQQKYGFYLNEISNLLNSGKNVCMIVRHFPSLVETTNYFCEKHVVLPLFVYASSDQALKRLLSCGYTRETAMKRILRKPDSLEHYFENTSFYRGTLINEKHEEAVMQSLGTYLSSAA